MWIYFSPNQSQNMWSWLFKKIRFGLEMVIFRVKSHLLIILIYNNTWWQQKYSLYLNSIVWCCKCRIMCCHLQYLLRMVIQSCAAIMCWHHQYLVRREIAFEGCSTWLQHLTRSQFSQDTDGVSTWLQHRSPCKGSIGTHTTVQNVKVLMELTQLVRM